MNIQTIMDAALNAGASHVADIELKDILFDPELRKSCEVNACGSYGRNWMCPPYCGEIEDCIAKAGSYTKALVIQYIGQLEDSYDFEGMMDAMEEFQRIFLSAVSLAREDQTDIYPLGAGGCKNCERCAILEQKPCRYPEKAFPSLESHGIFVSDLASKSGMNYINGQNTVTYFGAILY